MLLYHLVYVSTLLNCRINCSPFHFLQLTILIYWWVLICNCNDFYRPVCSPHILVLWCYSTIKLLYQFLAIFHFCFLCGAVYQETTNLDSCRPIESRLTMALSSLLDVSSSQEFLLCTFKPLTEEIYPYLLSRFRGSNLENLSCQALSLWLYQNFSHFL